MLATMPARPSNPDPELGHRVRDARTRLGVSWAELAEASGVNRSTIWRVEHGLVEPNAVTMKRLAVALGVEVGDLL